MSLEEQPTDIRVEKPPDYPIGPIDEQTARKRAGMYVMFHYGIGGTGQRRPVLENGKFISTVIYYSHGYGEVGDIATIEIDANTGKITYATPLEEAEANIERLDAEHGEKIREAWRTYSEKNTPG